MTAPARHKTYVSRAGTVESDSKTKVRKRSATRARSAAAERAYARREERRAQRDMSGRPAKQRSDLTKQPRQERPQAQRQPQTRKKPQTQKKPQTKKQPQTRATTSRVPLVVSSMSILGVGLVATLWLSIANVSGSYELQQQELKIESLNATKEDLVLHNSSQSSTPALQRHAFRQGLGLGSRPAYLVHHPDGSTTMVGEPALAPEAPSAQDGPKDHGHDPRQGGKPDSGPPAEAR